MAYGRFTTYEDVNETDGVEMIAAQRFNQDEFIEIFGIVTTGNFWQFAKLRQNILTMEIVSYSALENMQKLLNILNWIFYEAQNNVQKI